MNFKKKVLILSWISGLTGNLIQDVFYANYTFLPPFEEFEIPKCVQYPYGARLVKRKFGTERNQISTYVIQNFLWNKKQFKVCVAELWKNSGWTQLEFEAKTLNFCLRTFNDDSSKKWFLTEEDKHFRYIFNEDFPSIVYRLSWLDGLTGDILKDTFYANNVWKLEPKYFSYECYKKYVLEIPKHPEKYPFGGRVEYNYDKESVTIVKFHERPKYYYFIGSI